MEKQLIDRGWGWERRQNSWNLISVSRLGKLNVWQKRRRNNEIEWLLSFLRTSFIWLNLNLLLVTLRAPIIVWYRITILHNNETPGYRMACDSITSCGLKRFKLYQFYQGWAAVAKLENSDFWQDVQMSIKPNWVWSGWDMNERRWKWTVTLLVFISILIKSLYWGKF